MAYIAACQFDLPGKLREPRSEPIRISPAPPAPSRRSKSTPCLPLLAFLIHGLNAQTCLSLSTTAAAPGGTASLDLSLNSSSEMPASLQWTFQSPSSSISSLTVDNGPATTAAGKTVICTGNTTAYTCLVVGANAKTIANGVIAKVTASLSPDVTTAVIRISNPLGASAAGYFIPISSENGNVISANESADRKLRPPLRRIDGGRCR